MKTCEGCDFLKVEQWKKGVCATRCMAPFEPPFGNGFTMSVYSAVYKGEPPLWCHERPKFCTKE